VFLAKKHSTDASHGGDRRCPSVCRLTLGAAWIEGGDRRYGGRAMDADISVCRSVREGGFGAQERQTLGWSCDGPWRQHLSCVASAGLRASVATDAEPRLLIDRQTCLSWLSTAWELTVPRLSRDGR
jgi:hypothetical protein